MGQQTSLFVQKFQFTGWVKSRKYKPLTWLSRYRLKFQDGTSWRFQNLDSYQKWWSVKVLTLPLKLMLKVNHSRLTLKGCLFGLGWHPHHCFYRLILTPFCWTPLFSNNKVKDSNDETQRSFQNGSLLKLNDLTTWTCHFFDTIKLEISSFDILTILRYFKNMIQLRRSEPLNGCYSPRSFQNYKGQFFGQIV